MPTVIEVNCPDELEAYRLLWRAMLPQTRGGSFFQSLDWLLCYWRHFGERQKMRTLIVYSGGEAIGILPLTVIREKTGAGSVRTLTYPLHDWGTFYGPVGPNPTATLVTSMRHLYHTKRDWDLLDLRFINQDFVDHGRTRQAMLAAGFSPCVGRWTSTALVDLDRGWDAYVASRTSKFRNNLRRSERRVQRLGDVHYLRHRPLGASHDDDDPRWDLYDACVELARRSWQGASADGTTLSHPSIGDFLRDMHEVAARAGAVDLNCILLDGEPIAFAYNYHFQGKVMGLRSGHDPRYHHTGVGSLLYAKAIEDSCRRGDETYEFGPGSLEIKRRWQTRVLHSYRCTHYPFLSLRAQLLKGKRWLKLGARRPGDYQPKGAGSGSI